MRWRARKTERIEALRRASPEICTVTCADKLHNLRTIISEYDVIGDAVWDRFHGGVEDQAWYYRSVLDAISERHASLKNGQVCAKSSEPNPDVSDHTDVEDTTPQHEGSDADNAQQSPRTVDAVHPQLFQQFQQAVSYLFEGEF